jgi:hypothetical protein
VAAPVEPGTDACPAESFSEFLPAFANRDQIRARFTRLPLETVVRSHRASPEAPPDPKHPGMAVERLDDPRAHEVFAYRYDAALGQYEHVGMPLEPLQADFKADPEWSFNFDLIEESPSQVEIATGPEPERKAFVFVRESDCWYLTRAYDFGD